MIKKILDLYAFLFGRKRFYKLNKMLYLAGLRGLGILNFKENNVTNDEIIWLRSFISEIENPIIFDVGANIGEYSKALLELNSSCCIYAFEPHPKTFQKLNQTLNFTNIHFFNVGVGKQTSKMKLYDHESNDGSVFASVYKDVIEVLHKSKSIAYDIEIVSLDNIIKQYSINHIDLLKIDTEGNELEVLAGTADALKDGKIKVIHFEFNEMNIISKSTFKDFWDLLNNYNIYRLLPNGSLLQFNRYEAVYCEIYAYQNIIAISKEI